MKTQNISAVTGNRNGSVCVMMSSYNGERHIREQIDSIVKQFEQNDILIIRDDGSSDRTLSIIEALCHPQIKIIKGNNLGFAISFFWLLLHVETDHALYMLADQDDVWHDNKIRKAYKIISEMQQAAMYCSRLQLVDESLNTLGFSPLVKKSPQFWNAVCENIATGCTIALNKQALKIVREVPWEDFLKGEIIYHDWWLYLTISRFGTVFYDETPLIAYRQHGNNSVGMGAGLYRYITIFRSVIKKSWVAGLVRQLRMFYRVYSRNLSPHERIYLRRLSHGSSHRIAYYLLFSRKIFRQRKVEQVLLKVLVFFDLILGRIPSV